MSNTPTEKTKLVFPVKYTNVPDVEASWLWQPFIPMGDVTIVEGDGMAGKTTAMIRLACMVSNGEVPPSLIDDVIVEETKTEPANVLYIGIEANNETEIKPAIRFGKGNPDRMFFLDQSDTQFIIDDEYVRQAIAETNCKLLIMDPYTSFLPTGTNFNGSVEMRRILTRLMRIARETNTAIVLIGHLSKSTYGKQIYSGYGSADIINTVRSVLLISTDEDGNRYLNILKSNYFGVNALFKLGLSMDEDNCVQFIDYQQMLDEQRREEKELASENIIPNEPTTPAGRCKVILEDLLQYGPMKKKDVMMQIMPMGFSKRTISRAFKGMGGISYFEGRTGYWKLED